MKMSLQLDKFNNADFSRGASRFKESIWILIKMIFFIPPFPFPSSLRCNLLRQFGARVGKRVVIRSGVNITFPWRVEIGDSCWIGEQVTILSLAPVTIEDNCCISQQAFLCTGSHKFKSPTFDLVVKPIVIRRGSWIAARCFVGPGVEFGPDSMAAAGCVVAKAVPAGVVVAGNPAKIRTGQTETV